MSLHRVNDDTLLNQKEYQEYKDETWGGILFIIGALASGFAIHFLFSFFELLDLPKWLRFSCIISGAIATGVIAIWLRQAIQLVLLLTIAGAFIFGLGYLVWIAI